MRNSPTNRARKCFVHLAIYGMNQSTVPKWRTMNCHGNRAGVVAAAGLDPVTMEGTGLADKYWLFFNFYKVFFQGPNMCKIPKFQLRLLLATNQATNFKAQDACHHLIKFVGRMSARCTDCSATFTETSAMCGQPSAKSITF